MSWFRVADRRLTYRGRITREPFALWAQTKDGAAAIEEVARTLRFRLLGRRRAARRLIWRDLQRAARSEPLRSAIQAEAEHFVAVLADLSYAAGLPRERVALRRLVVVPRALVAGRAREALRRRLWHTGSLVTLSESVRAFFCEQLLTEMGRAFDPARLSLAHPVFARDEWWCVGADRESVWMDPMWSGPDWLGHLLVYEFPQSGLSRRERKELSSAIEKLQHGVTTLSRLQREGIVRMATQ
jgi:hypothetical protein